MVLWVQPLMGKGIMGRRGQMSSRCTGDSGWITRSTWYLLGGGTAGSRRSRVQKSSAVIARVSGRKQKRVRAFTNATGIWSARRSLQRAWLPLRGSLRWSGSRKVPGICRNRLEMLRREWRVRLQRPVAEIRCLVRLRLWRRLEMLHRGRARCPGQPPGEAKLRVVSQWGHRRLGNQRQRI